MVNPAQRLDFARFSSDALLACFRRERDILRELSPGIPVTTNFMATNCKSIDYWRWAPEVDVISNDNYLLAEKADGYLDLANVRRHDQVAGRRRPVAADGALDERGELAPAQHRQAPG